MSQDRDYIVRATAAEGSIRAFAITSRHLVEVARVDHDTSPVITAALGRLLSGAAMMGTMMKGEKDLLTIQIQCGGPAKGFTVTADANGHVKGFPNVPDVELPLNAQGKLDVGGALGLGVMSVIKDMGLKEPYVGQIALQTGEIAEDLTYYFATSEQVPSAVGLGVLVNPDRSVRQAGGFIIQLMPFVGEEVIGALEKNLAAFSTVTTVLDGGKTPEEMLQQLLAGLDPVITEKVPCRYECSCSRERMERAIISIGKKDIEEMINDGEAIEVNCQFCGNSYHFSVEELKEMLKAAR